MSRLPAPYGDCIPDGKGTEYIYDNYEYSVEVCKSMTLMGFDALKSFRVAIDHASNSWFSKTVCVVILVSLFPMEKNIVMQLIPLLVR